MSTVILLAAMLAQTNPSPTTRPAEPTPATASAPLLTLDQAIAEAHTSNLDLKAAEARLKQANQISSKVWAGYLPNVTAAAIYTRNQEAAALDMPTGYWLRTLPDVGNLNGPPAGLGVPGSPSSDVLMPSGMQKLVIQPLDQVTGQIQVTQGIILPQLWAGISNAYSAEHVAEMSVEAARREILFGVEQIYYGAVGAKKGLEAQQRLLEASLAHERDARTRVDAGAQPRIALIRAQIDRARAEQDVKRAEFSLASMKIALGTMLQHKDDFDIDEPGEPKVDSGNGKALEDAALRDRPDVLAARASLDLASGQKTQTWLAYLPNVFASAAYRYANFTGFTNKNWTWVASLTAQWSIFDGGLREANLREASARLVEAQANATNAEAKAIDDVRKGLLDLESARANAQKAQEQLNLARENMRLVEVNFNSGVATQLDVTDAQTALRNAEIGAIGDRLNAQLAAVRLLKAAGAFNP